ncbi:hypothetical protein PHMEG_00012903 [Phytophthora megakarya]|uniref:Tf2-1-like SH3-like domain-containing protein n=1 Tax=Phytophthora megakarya TaxID=4795 RepID=A0A225W9R2_9STRA|nr:hypothetical protein PHMEG_00012903 [Phytophthora megakarya]
MAGIQPILVTNVGANKLAPRFIGPFKILKVLGDAYTLLLPTVLRLHPTFYAGRLRRYHPVVTPNVSDTPTVLPPASLDVPLLARRLLHHIQLATQIRHLTLQPRQPLRCALSTPRRLRLHPPTLCRVSSAIVRHPLSIVLAVLATLSSRSWGHDDHRAVLQHARTGRGRVARDGPIPPHCQYLVRWLSPMPDSWEPRAVLLEDVPDCVAAYEAVVLTAAGLPDDATVRRA